MKTNLQRVVQWLSTDFNDAPWFTDKLILTVCNILAYINRVRCATSGCFQNQIYSKLCIYCSTDELYQDKSYLHTSIEQSQCAVFCVRYFPWYYSAVTDGRKYYQSVYLLVPMYYYHHIVQGQSLCFLGWIPMRLTGQKLVWPLAAWRYRVYFTHIYFIQIRCSGQGFNIHRPWFILQNKI